MHFLRPHFFFHVGLSMYYKTLEDDESLINRENTFKTVKNDCPRIFLSMYDVQLVIGVFNRFVARTKIRFQRESGLLTFSILLQYVNFPDMLIYLGRAV